MKGYKVTYTDEILGEYKCSILPLQIEKILGAESENSKTTMKTELKLTNLRAARTYKIKVAALNGAGSGPQSSILKETKFLI